MRSIHSILSGRVSSIRKRVVKSKPRTRRTATGNVSLPGFTGLSEQLERLARASERLRGSRHGRRTG
jgi:hypothetical protein